MNSQQRMRNQQQSSCSKNWQEMFPNSQQSELTSNLFIKKLVAIAVSNITYLRNIFPEAAFTDRYLEGLHLKVLRDKGQFLAVSQLIRWIKGSFEAMDHRYLRKLIIGVYTECSDPNNVLETYSFHFSYTNNCLSSCSYSQDDGKTRRELLAGKIVSAEETFRQTISLFRHCLMCTQSLKPLPVGALINMRLLYYDEVTPDDYEPPGFKPSPVASYTFVNKPISVNLGQTDTPWHSVKFFLAADASDFEVATDTSTTNVANNTPKGENQALKSAQQDDNENPIEMPIMETPKKKKLNSKNSAIQDSQNAVVPTSSPEQPTSAVSSTGTSVAESGGLQSPENQVRCPCGSTERDGLMIKCLACNFWQHANCFKVITEEEIPQVHVCELCNDSRNPCTDVSLLMLMPNQRKETCIYRRALIYSSENFRISVEDLAENLGIDTAMAQNTIKKLDEDGALKLTTKRSKGKFRLVNKYNLKQKILPRYFYEDPAATSETPKGINTPTQRPRENIEDPLKTPKNSSNEDGAQEIEEMAEKMSISHSQERMEISESVDVNQDDQVINKSSILKSDGKRMSSDEEICGPSKKKCKVSISDNFLF